tara:strand:+ start:243 stop:965 length:723 start_codon:yes stop_codon:yes gene_type:complete
MLFISPPFGNYINFSSQNIGSIKGSFTVNQRDGLFFQIIKTLRYSLKYEGWVNKIGLRNKGIDWALSKYPATNKNEIISVAIIETEDINKLLKKIPKTTNLEINVSCPNVEKDIKKINNLSSFLNNERKWCIIKLSPFEYRETIDHYYKQGFRQFHCCNTLPTKNGGLSGKNLKPHSLRMVKYIRENYKDAEIIGGGGIQTLNDIRDYKKAGANHFSISTLCFNPIRFLSFYYDLISLKN